MKRLLIYNGHGAINIMRTAYARAFKQIGWEVYMHNPEDPNVATLDVFDRIEPTAVFLGTYEIDRPTFKAIQKRPELQLILWGPNHGPLNSEIAPEDGVLCISEQEKVYLDQIIKNNNVSTVYTYYHQNCVEGTHSYYRRDFSLEPQGICLAADLFDYGVGDVKPEYISDWSFVGGHWALKAQNLNRFLYPLCLIPELKGRIYGYGSWAVPQAVGGISTENIKHIIKSSTVMPNVLEPHSIKFGVDYNERAYKIMSAGGFCVSQRILSAERDIFTNNEMVFVDTPEEMRDAILHYVRNPDERQPYIERGMRYAYTDGNYFARARELCRSLGMIEEVIQLDQICSDIAKGMGY